MKAGETNPKAFKAHTLREAYRSYAKPLSAYICFHVRSADDGEELLHEVFIVASKRFDTWDPNKPIQPWLYGIAHNLVMNHVRKRQRRQTYASDELEQRIDPNSQTHDAEKNLVRVVLNQLDEMYRELLWLSDVQGFSAREIAEMTETSQNTISSRIRTSRIKFREIYERLVAESMTGRLYE